MKRKILTGAGVLLVLLAAGAGLFWWWMGQPLYHPGDVRPGRNLRAPLDPPAQSGEPGRWQVERDIALRYFTSGTGANLRVVHGGPGFPVHEPYAGLEPLAGRFRFHYYDQRGCGVSTRPIDRLDPRDFRSSLTRLEQTLGAGAQIADLERIRRILGEERLLLVGHSWGALLAALYAAEFPGRVRAMVLISPADMLLMPSPHGDLFEQIRRRLPEDQRAAYDAWLRRYMDFSGVFAKSEQELAREQQEMVPFYITAAGGTLKLSAAPGPAPAGGWMVRAQFFSMGRRHGYREALKQVNAPVLVVHGEKDLQPVSASRAYVRALPNAKFAVLPGAGRFPQVEAPEAFSRAVAEFLAGA